MAGTGFNRFEDTGAAPATEAVSEEREGAGAAAAAAAVEGGAEDGEEDKAVSAAIEVDEDSDDWFERNGISKSAELIQLKELGTNKLAEAHLSMRAELLRLRVECEQLRGVLAVAGGSNGSANDELSGQSAAGGGGDVGSGASGKSANTSEWHEIFDLEEPSPHAFGSQVIQHVIESWFEEQRKSDFFQAQRKREFVTGWLRHLVENEGVRNCVAWRRCCRPPHLPPPNALGSHMHACPVLFFSTGHRHRWLSHLRHLWRPVQRGEGGIPQDGGAAAAAPQRPGGRRHAPRAARRTPHAAPANCATQR